MARSNSLRQGSPLSYQRSFELTTFLFTRIHMKFSNRSSTVKPPETINESFTSSQSSLASPISTSSGTPLASPNGYFRAPQPQGVQTQNQRYIDQC